MCNYLCHIHKQMFIYKLMPMSPQYALCTNCLVWPSFIVNHIFWIQKSLFHKYIYIKHIICITLYYNESFLINK